MDYVGIAEIAKLANVTKQAVDNWRKRFEDFPAPAMELASGPVWHLEIIRRWLKDNKKGEKMAKVISWINLKGGVGKTTSTVAVAEFLAVNYGKKCLVVDLDPQTNATIALISEEEWEKRDKEGKTLRQLFADRLQKTALFNIEDAIIPKVSNLGGGVTGLDLLPSSLGLIDLQDQLALIPGGAFFSVSPVTILKSVLQPLMDTYDYIFIDCPPNLGIITLNGIVISDGFIIPTIPDILSTYGIPQILNRIEEFAKTAGITITPYGIVVSKYRDQSPLHRSKVEQMRGDAARKKLPPVFDTIVPEAAGYAAAADYGNVVSTLRQKYGYGNYYDVYDSLAKEVIDKCA